MKSVWRWLARWPAHAAGGLVLCGALAWIVAVLMASPPSFDEIRASSARGLDAQLLARDGTVLQRLRLDMHSRRLPWTSLDQMSGAMVDAMIAAEDRRFVVHAGIDGWALASAMIDNLHRQRARGASTLTMQLADLLAGSGRDHARDWLGKLRQMRDASAIELHWTKREILEAYLNLVTFRGELVGIAAASNGLLAKGPNGLDRADAAVLAALVRAPGASRSAVANRACGVLAHMKPGGQVGVLGNDVTTHDATTHDATNHDATNQGATTHGAREAHATVDCTRTALVATALPKFPYSMPGIDEAPHLARQLLHAPGQSVRSTLDAELQRFAADTLRNHLAELQTRNVEDGAVVVLDNASGEVLAYVGSSGDLSGAAEVDGVIALRQPGSALKPFLYAIAIDQGWLTAASVLDDSPLALTTPTGLYIPQDYDREYRGAVSVRTALASSLNVPAVRTLALVGVDRFLERLRTWGLDSLTRDADHYGYGLALGAAETNLLSLTNAYRALANGGVWAPVQRLSADVQATPRDERESASDMPQPGRRRVLSAQASFVIADILSDPAARAPTFGMASPLSARTWAAVKTGTSKGMRDNWAVGFTDRYTVGVWVGNFSGASMWDVSGVTGAAPVWREIVEHLHEAQASRAPTVPAGVVARAIRYTPALEPERVEWFVGRDGAVGTTRSPATDGTQPMTIALQLPSARAHLVAPPDGSVIAPDPDIPRGHQSVLIQASGGAGTHLMLDAHPIAANGVMKVFVPLPAPGRHEIALIDAKGQVLDHHQIDVRPLAATRGRRDSSVASPVVARP